MKQKILKIFTGLISISLPLALMLLFSLGYLRSEILGLISLIIIGELILFSWFLIHTIYKDNITKTKVNASEHQSKTTQSSNSFNFEKEIANA